MIQTHAIARGLRPYSPVNPNGVLLDSGGEAVSAAYVGEEMRNLFGYMRDLYAALEGLLTAGGLGRATYSGPAGLEVGRLVAVTGTGFVGYAVRGSDPDMGPIGAILARVGTQYVVQSLGTIMLRCLSTFVGPPGTRLVLTGSGFVEAMGSAIPANDDLVWGVGVSLAPAQDGLVLAQLMLEARPGYQVRTELGVEGGW